MDSEGPVPMIFEGGGSLYVIFWALLEDGAGEDIYTIKFNGVSQYKFGTPNDENITGHPYHSLGLGRYAFYEVLHSDWTKGLKKINSGHSKFDERTWDKKRHFIITFRDETFECVADSFEINQEKNSVEQKFLDLVHQYILP